MSSQQAHKSVLLLLPKYLKGLPSAQKKKLFVALFYSLISVILDLFGVGILLQMVIVLFGKAMYLPLFVQQIMPADPIAAVLLLALFFVIKSGLSVFIHKTILDIVYHIGRSETSKEANQILTGKIDFSASSSSQQINRLFNLAFYLPDVILTSFFQLFAEFLVGVLVILCAWYLTGSSLVIIVGVLLPPIVAVFYFIRNRIRSNGKHTNELTPFLYRSVNDIVHGSGDITLAKKQAHFVSRVDKFTRKIHRYKANTAILSNQFTLRFVEVAVAFALLIFVVIQHYLYQEETDITLKLGVFGVLAFRVLPSLNRILGALNQLNNFSFVLEQLLATPQVKKAGEQQAKTAFNSLETKDLTFGYAKDNTLWENLNFIINKGDMVGISGASGSGKSSLLQVLLGFEKAQKGELILNGSPLVNTELSNRVPVSMVKQEVYLLQGSIAENVAMSYEPDWNTADIEEALKKAELLDWVQQLPMGINSQVGELGTLISGGQKQRLAIARALYHKAAVLFFDEATRALDVQTEKAIQNTLQQLTKQGNTIVWVSHNPEVLNLCDWVVNLDDYKVKS